MYEWMPHAILNQMFNIILSAVLCIHLTSGFDKLS